tara:strand:+ start:536 stop:778 length:243 start_codon:yes stop_codon:yes gene_type:complete
MIRTVLAAGLVTCFTAGAVLAQSGPEFEDMRAACREDIERLCSNVEPIEAVECLQENADKVSQGCKTTVENVRKQDQGHD